MLKQGRFLFFIITLSAILSGCLSGLWTGATLVYDRHDVYKKLNDYHILVDLNNSLYRDKELKCGYCVLDIVVFNGDILIAGHLPTADLRRTVQRRLVPVQGYRHLYTQIAIKQAVADNFQDSWITTKIRSQIFTDDSIDPNTFKVVTSDRIVYLMGDVQREDGEKVIKIARHTAGVERVVTLMKYITYQSRSTVTGSKVA